MGMNKDSIFGWLSFSPAKLQVRIWILSTTSLRFRIVIFHPMDDGRCGVCRPTRATQPAWPIFGSCWLQPVLRFLHTPIKRELHGMILYGPILEDGHRNYNRTWSTMFTVRKVAQCRLAAFVLTGAAMAVAASASCCSRRSVMSSLDVILVLATGTCIPVSYTHLTLPTIYSV